MSFWQKRPNIDLRTITTRHLYRLGQLICQRKSHSLRTVQLYLQKKYGNFIYKRNTVYKRYNTKEKWALKQFYSELGTKADCGDREENGPGYVYSTHAEQEKFKKKLLAQTRT